jgi:hypothetical protein
MASFRDIDESIPIGTRYYDPHQRTSQIWTGNHWYIEGDEKMEQHLEFSGIYSFGCKIPESSILFELIKGCVELSFMHIEPQEERDLRQFNEGLKARPDSLAEYFKKDIDALLKTPVKTRIEVNQDFLKMKIQFAVGVCLDQRFIDTFDETYHQEMLRSALEDIGTNVQTDNQEIE